MKYAQRLSGQFSLIHQHGITSDSATKPFLRLHPPRVSLAFRHCRLRK
jgi:hypothetical protein